MVGDFIYKYRGLIGCIVSILIFLFIMLIYSAFSNIAIFLSQVELLLFVSSLLLSILYLAEYLWNTRRRQTIYSRRREERVREIIQSELGRTKIQEIPLREQEKQLIAQNWEDQHQQDLPTWLIPLLKSRPGSQTINAELQSAKQTVEETESHLQTRVKELEQEVSSLRKQLASRSTIPTKPPSPE